VKRPPRLVARTLAVTFGTVAVILTVVFVVLTFDAMTSARAYRPARPAAEAVAELERHSGTQFDPESVVAFCAAFPLSTHLAEPELQELLGRAHV
jgi:response regulator RpfG family c-di-GMP phosphodiesterase